MKRNITKKWILCLSVLATCICSCEDDLESKDEFDAKHAVKEKPTLTVGEVNVLDYSTAEIKLSIRDVANIAEIGAQLSHSEDMSNPTYLSSEVRDCEMQLSLNQLEANSTYYAIPYLYLKDGSSIFGSAVTFSTPDAPFTAKMLEGKSFVASGVIDYNNYSWNFNVTIEVDSEDPTKVYVYGLFPYAEYYNYNACISKVYGYVDTENMTLTIPSYQSLQPEALSYFGITALDTSWNYVDNIIFDISDKGKILTSRDYLSSYYNGYYYDLFLPNLKLTVQ